MNIFMLGWEFPPFISGGLGTACYGLTKALSELGHHVIFVLPQPVAGTSSTHVKLKTPSVELAQASYRAFTLREFDNVEFRAVPSSLQPYVSPDPRLEEIHQAGQSVSTHDVVTGGGTKPGKEAPASILGERKAGSNLGQYGGDMFSEARRFAEIAVILARTEQFEVVHAHDWMTYHAGIAVARAMGKPLVVHVHSTEFDRSGEHVNQQIYDIGREGVSVADK